MPTTMLMIILALYDGVRKVHISALVTSPKKLSCCTVILSLSLSLKKEKKKQKHTHTKQTQNELVDWSVNYKLTKLHIFLVAD